ANSGGFPMRANYAVVFIAVSGLLAAGSLLYKQPASLAPESGLGLDATASAPPPRKHIREAQLARPEQASARPPVATDRSPASSQSESPVSALRRPFKTPFKILETLLTRDAPPNSDGSHVRTQIVRTVFKYPLLRIEERVSADGSLLGTREMVADHVLVQL